MYEFLLVLAVLLFFALKYRETFVVKYGNPVNDEDLLSFDPNSKGKRLFALTPDTCNANEELQAGMCYTRCDEGYTGNVTICSANTVDVGAGWIPELRWKKEERTSWGSVNCTGGRPFRIQGYGDCYTNTIDVPYQHCPDDRELLDGLCYIRCPPNKPERLDGRNGKLYLPHLCYRGGRLTYDRGAGRAPAIFAGPE